MRKSNLSAIGTPPKGSSRIRPQKKGDFRFFAFQDLSRFLACGEFKLRRRNEFPVSFDYRAYSNRCHTVLRFLSKLDAYAEILLGRDKENITPSLRVSLWIALAEIVYLGVKEHAAVNEAVKLCGTGKKKFLKAVANASLLNFIRNRKSVEERWEGRPEKRFNGFPEWMFARWKQNYGEERTARLTDSMNLQPDIVFHARPGDLRELSASLLEEGFGMRVEMSLPDCFRLHKTEGVFATRSFLAGRFIVQDLSSQIFCDVLAGEIQESFLDFCGAPGGKTIHLAWKRKEAVERFRIADASTERLRQVEENLSRVGIEVEIERLGRRESSAEKFGWVLVDAPCSATGAIRKYPEIRWTLNPERLRKHQAGQLQILAEAWERVLEGGVLVYSTCSLESEENEDVLRAFATSRNEAHLLRWSRIFSSEYEDENGFFRLLPDESRMGFFAGSLLKRSVAQ